MFATLCLLAAIGVHRLLTPARLEVAQFEREEAGRPAAGGADVHETPFRSVLRLELFHRSKDGPRRLPLQSLGAGADGIQLPSGAWILPVFLSPDRPLEAVPGYSTMFLVGPGGRLELLSSDTPTRLSAIPGSDGYRLAPLQLNRPAGDTGTVWRLFMVWSPTPGTGPLSAKLASKKRPDAVLDPWSVLEDLPRPPAGGAPASSGSAKQQLEAWEGSVLLKFEGGAR